MSDASCYVQGKEVTVRPALLEDYNEVLDIIPNMYEGGDHLPVTYHSYFSDPQAYPFVGVVDGKVVSEGFHKLIVIMKLIYQHDEKAMKHNRVVPLL